MKLQPDLQISVASAQAILDHAAAGSSVSGVSRLHGGEIAAIYEVAIVGRPSLILKIYPDDLHWKMRKEVTVLGLIGDRLSVPVPRILLADDSKRWLGLNFTLMTRLDGVSLGGLEKTLSAAQRLGAYVLIGRLLREIHRIPMDGFGYIGPNGIWTAHATNRLYLTHQFERKLNEFTERGGEPHLAAQVASYAAGRATLLEGCTQAVLCHNDLHAGNLLAAVAGEGVRLTGLVDFEGALAGDPLMDVAKALYFLDTDSRRAVLDGYGVPDRDRWAETLELYHLYFVLELWCWMAQIGNGQALGKLASDLARGSAGSM